MKKLSYAFHGNPRLWANQEKDKTSADQILENGKNNLILSTRHPIERAFATWYTAFKRATPLGAVEKQKARRRKLHKKFVPKLSPFMVMYNRTIRATLKIEKFTDLGDSSHWITWPQYVEWITTKGQGNHNMILPQFEFCDICSRNYKYITKTRTLGDDVEYLFKINDDINVDYYNSNPKQPLHARHTIGMHTKGLDLKQKTNEVALTVKKYLKMLDKDLVKKLNEKYAIDLQAFGYSFNPRNLMIGGLDL